MPESTQLQEPEGIPFFSIKSGETHHCKLEPTIAAYINSSDMGINASRDQDYGWRLDPDWVKKIRAFKRDSLQMSILTAKNSGQKPNTTQILYYIYGEQLARFYESQEEFENPFEEAYLAAINSGSSIKDAADKAGMPQALADFRATAGDEDDDLADLIDDEIMDDELDAPAPTPEPQKAPEGADTTVKVDGDKVTAPATDGKTSTAKPTPKQK